MDWLFKLYQTKNNKHQGGVALLPAEILTMLLHLNTLDQWRICGEGTKPSNSSLQLIMSIACYLTIVYSIPCGDWKFSRSYSPNFTGYFSLTVEIQFGSNVLAYQTRNRVVLLPKNLLPPWRMTASRSSFLWISRLPLIRSSLITEWPAKITYVRRCYGAVRNYVLSKYDFLE